jgi:hypothetical protein
METRILVPLDGSHLSEQSLPYAMTLGQRLPAELVLFSAVSMPSDVREALEKAGLEPEPLFEELEIEAGEYLRALAQLLSKAELTVSHVVQRSRAAEAIVEYAEQADIQLLTLHQIKGVPRSEWPTTPAARIMSPAARAKPIGPDSELWIVLQEMDRSGVTQLPVMTNGPIVGMLTREGIMRFLRTLREKPHYSQ